jgi:hypothetical protein
MMPGPKKYPAAGRAQKTLKLGVYERTAPNPGESIFNLNEKVE